MGNSIHSSFPFARLADPRSGMPRNPITQPLSYEGNRDTDPRYVLLARERGASPFIANLHLTTLVGGAAGHDPSQRNGRI